MVRGREGRQGDRLALMRLDIAVRHRAADGHAEAPPSRDVGGSGDPGNVGGARRVRAGRRALCVPCTKVDNRRAIGGNRQAVCGRCGHRLVMDGAEQIRLHDLGLRQRGRDVDDRLVPENWRPFRHGSHLAAESETFQPVQEIPGKAVQRGQVFQVGRGDGQPLQVFQRRFQPAGDQQVAVRRQAAAEQVECRGFGQAVFPVGLHHAQLIHVGQQRVGGGRRVRPSGHAGAACSRIAPAARMASSAALPSPGEASTARMAFAITCTSSPGSFTASSTLAFTQ